MLRRTPSEAFVETIATHGVTDIFDRSRSRGWQMFCWALDLTTPMPLRYQPSASTPFA
jgi:hypothetical protein